MKLDRHYFNNPDYCFIVLGLGEELDQLTDSFHHKLYPSIDIGGRFLSCNGQGELIWSQKFAFTNPQEAMMFKLAVPR